MASLKISFSDNQASAENRDGHQFGVFYFWRDNNGVEADLVFETGVKLQPVEIKSGSTVTSDYIKAGQRAGRFASEETELPWLIYGGDDSCERSGVQVISWREMGDWV